MGAVVAGLDEEVAVVELLGAVVFDVVVVFGLVVEEDAAGVFGEVEGVEEDFGVEEVAEELDDELDEGELL